MLDNYLPILVFLFIALIIGIAMISAAGVLSKHKPNPEKNSAYECGFAPFENAHIPFDVRFYLVAILFILFDLETAFFFPWAVVIRKIGWTGFFSMSFFLILLLIGFAYEWKKGALDWE